MATEYRLAFSGGLNLANAANLRSRIAHVLEQPDFGSLTLVYSSEGGSTDQSLSLYNFISRLPVPVHIHAAGHVGSASVPLFLSGHRRTCAEFSRFFFHEYDWGFDGRQTLRRITEAVQRLTSDIELAREIIQRNTKATSKILKALDGTAAPTILTPEKAKELGFVHDICELSDTPPQGDKIAIWTCNVT